MISLPQVTLIAIATQNVDSTGRALVYSCRGIEFATVKLVSPYRPSDLPEYVQWEYIDPFPSIDDWNRYMVYDLWRHFDTDYCLLLHADSAIINPQSWLPEFLQYDYIGSAWDEYTSIAIQGGRDQEYTRVGNSVGIRSRKLCKLPSEIGMEWKRYNADSNEDTFISAHNWRQFAEHSCTKAPLEIAVLFGREAEIPENQHVEYPFLFHKWVGRSIHYPRF